MDELDKKVLSEVELEIPNTDIGITAKSESITPEEEALIAKDSAKTLAYGNSAGTAAVLGGARGLTLGLSDQFLTKTGLVKPETLKEIKEYNELASLTSEVAGTVASALSTGGTSAIAKGIQVLGAPVTAITKSSLAVEKALAKVLSEQGSKSIAKQIVAKTIPTAAGSAVEGAAYGIGQLISEDALGTSQFNAESALASAGIGALLGGSVGGLFAAPASLLPVVEKGASRLRQTTGTKFTKATDPKEAALDLYGFTPTQRAKLKNKNVQFVDDLPQWTIDKVKLGYFTGAEKLKSNIEDILEQSGKTIANTIKSIDNVAEMNPGILPSAKSVYADIASNVQKDIIEEYKNVPGFKKQLAPVKEIVNDFISLAKTSGDIRVSQLHDLRKKIDEQIKFDKLPGTYTLKEQALNDVRHMLNDQISKLAEKADIVDAGKNFGSLLKDLKTANKDYSYASRILPNIDKKIEKDAAKKTLGLTDLMAIMSGEVLQEGLGGAVILGKKFLESDLRRRVNILSSIEKQNQKISNTINASIPKFIKSEKLPQAAKTVTSLTLIKSRLSEDSKGRKPTSKEEAFKNITNRIADYKVNPESLQKTLTTRMFGMNQIAPNTALQISTTAVKALNFLDSKLPKPSTDLINKDKFTKREYQPSEIILSKFSRYLEAIENPLSALEDLQRGTLTSEKVEVLQQIYPNIYFEIQQKVMEFVETSKEPIPYEKRLQLGVLLNIPTDESLKPQNIAGLQTSFAPTEQTVPTKQARAEALTIAERTETEQNKIAQQ